MYSKLAAFIALILTLIVRQHQVFAVELVDTTNQTRYTDTNNNDNLVNEVANTTLSKNIFENGDLNETTTIKYIGGTNETVFNAHHDKSINYLADRNKLIHNESFIPNTIEGTRAGGSALSVPITVIVVVFSVVIVVIFVIVSALFVMRKRFSKWRLNIIDSNGTSQVNGINGKLNAIDDDEEKKASLLTNEAENSNNNNKNDNDNGVGGGHTNEGAATSVSQSTDSITIENEITKPISDATVILSTNVNENTETSKLLVQETQTQIQTNQQEMPQNDNPIDDNQNANLVNNLNENDSEKEPLNQ